MSAGLARASQSIEAPKSGPSPLLSLFAAAIFPFDRVLAGMVGAGHGIEAVCLYLGLSRASLHDNLARLGLRTPHDRALRKPGARGWSVLDTMRLIAWRVAGIHPATIGERLGRSPNAVRAKARRLGIPRPERKSLRRVDPTTLPDPEPGFGLPEATSEPLHAGPSDAAAADAAAAAAAADRCGTATGASWFRAGAAGGDVVALHPALPADAIVVPAPASRARGSRAGRKAAGTGQRELQLFRVVPGGDARPGEHEVSDQASVSLRSPSRPAAPTEAAPSLDLPLPEPATGAEDLAWVGKTCRLAFDEALVRLVSLRAFGGEHWKVTAKLLGFTEPALRTLRTRIDLPADLSYSRTSGSYNHERALANLAASGWELYQESRPDEAGSSARTGRWFWRRKGSGQRLSLYTRRQRGLMDADESRRFRPRVSFASCPA